MTARGGSQQDPWHPHRRTNAWWMLSIGGALWPYHAVLALAFTVYAVLRGKPAVLIPALVVAVVAVFEWRHERSRRRG